MLIGVFIYWGWESAVNLTEETEDSRRAPGLAAVGSTVILVLTYVSVGTAVVAFARPRGARASTTMTTRSSACSPATCSARRWDKLVLLAVATSAISSTQTTIIPASRTTLSMARSDAYPSVLARIHDALPDAAHRDRGQWRHSRMLWYVPANFISQNFLFDSFSAPALMIAFYYALTGIACARVLPSRAHEVGEELHPDGRRARSSER